jgi:regulatory protein YycI of two-component signal transduction system YycFG
MIYNSTIKEYVYFNTIKQPGASFKYSILIPAIQTTESTKSTSSIQAVEAIKVKATKTG